MESILKRLYEGDIYPSEQINIQREEYKTACKKFSDCYSKFSEKLKALNPEWCNDLETLMEKKLDAISIETTEAFIEGFCIGAKMIVEVYEKGCINS